ncbi:polyprenyl synthetase family protein [Streptomyces natalensis]|uniref:polyprenyl synthetase family protein n=1 Tax=Streptomyces natalensis TaxID=68242 RepID=UPI000ABC3606|nr:polyprenyl synthetase family protein [Streptomyces natalensis]
MAEAAQLTEAVRGFLAAGGKRLRPLLCVLGWAAAGGRGDTSPVFRVAASLEMFHAFALIHDDVMDRSETRRGRPTLQHTLTAAHAHGTADAEEVGASAALLVGDLVFAWSCRLLHTAGLREDRLSAVLSLVDDMRSEVMYGQFLDLVAGGRSGADVEAAVRIARHKTASYTIEYPLRIGAALADAPTTLHRVLSEFGRPLGEAFQLRDDLLGVFGDPDCTGKPVVDDLRAGKHTALLALALQRADPGQRAALDAVVGDPSFTEDDASRVRGIFAATGARDTVEQMISDRYAQAVRALERVPFPPAAAEAMRGLADAVVARTT